MATLVTCRGLSKAFGLQVLFEGLSVAFEDGERVGFIGPNGAGKTTFLRMLAGLDVPDQGEIIVRRQARIGYVPQHEAFPPDATVAGLLAEAVAGEDLAVHERDTRVSMTLSRCGFTQADERVAALSGGWRKRLAIARELSRQPDFLLLDEPTNHLDIDGVLWLEALLAAAPVAFVVISHDRAFLEHVANRVVELNPVYPEGFFSVAGPYSTFLAKRAEFLEAQHAQQATLAGVVRREAAFLQSNSKAQRTKSKARIEEAYRLQDQLRALQQRNTRATRAGIDFEGTGRRSRKLIEATDLSKSLGGRPLFGAVSLRLSPGSRVGLVGNNGSGKTTFIRVLVGELPPDGGTLHRADGLQIVVFDQARESLPPDVPLRRALVADSDSVLFRGQKMHVTAWAKRFLFRIDQLDLPVRELSGGEQARILIARLMLKPADVLILDEPTNDLDIDSLDVLEGSLAEFPGAIVLVTHDRFMLQRLCSEVIGFDGDGHAAGYASTAQWLDARERRAQARAAPAPQSDKPARRPRRGGLTASEQKELQMMEQTIQEAETDAGACRAALESVDGASDHVEVQRRWAALDHAKRRVEALYARWEELEAKRQETSG